MLRDGERREGNAASGEWAQGQGIRAFEEKLQRYWLLRIRYSGAHRSRNQVSLLLSE